MAHHVSARAGRDLDEIWDYVFDQSGSSERADRLIRSLTHRFYLLGDRPFLGRARPDLRADLRSFPHGNYLILYRVDQEKDVTILNVFSASRDVASAMSWASVKPE